MSCPTPSYMEYPPTDLDMSCAAGPAAGSYISLEYTSLNDRTGLFRPVSIETRRFNNTHRERIIRKNRGGTNSWKEDIPIFVPSYVAQYYENWHDYRKQS
jgi:hypothetical protein